MRHSECKTVLDGIINCMWIGLANHAKTSFDGLKDIEVNTKIEADSLLQVAYMLDPQKLEAISCEYIYKILPNGEEA